MSVHLPPLSALRAFEAAARHMSFSKAADELHVTPAAISHQIHALEEDLGVRLFYRMNRSIELTASARVLLPGLSEAFVTYAVTLRAVSADTICWLVATSMRRFSGADGCPHF